MASTARKCLGTLATLLVLVLGTIGPAFSQRYGDWTVGASGGYVEYFVAQGTGNDFNITCNVAATENAPGVSLFITIGGRNPPRNSAVKIVLDGVEYGLPTNKDGQIDVDCDHCRLTLKAIWAALRKSRVMTVHFGSGSHVDFSLRGSARALEKDLCGGTLD